MEFKENKESQEIKESLEIEESVDIIQLKPVKSKLVTACYVVAIIALLFAVYAIFSTVAYVVSYSKAYGMPVKFVDIIKYVLQGGVLPIAVAFFSYVLGRILHEVRLLNPEYYVEAGVLANDEEMIEETESDDICDDEACPNGDLSDDCDKCSDKKDDVAKCDELKSEDK